MARGRSNAPTGLLLEGRADLRALEDLILRDLGVRAENLPSDQDPVDVAARGHPDLIVVHIGISEPYHVELIDQLHRNPGTRAIPVVVIAASEQRAASAKASPNVPATVVAPYDIEDFERAVRRALNLAVPSADVAATGHDVSEPVQFAASQIDRNARAIALQTMQGLLGTEAFRAHFAQLTPGLIEDSGSVVAQVAEGLRRGLSPREIWETPAAQRLVDAHLRTREAQGVDIATVVLEPRALNSQIDRFVQGLVGKNGFTESNAALVGRRCREFLLAYIRRLASQYRSPTA